MFCARAKPFIKVDTEYLFFLNLKESTPHIPPLFSLFLPLSSLFAVPKGKTISSLERSIFSACGSFEAWGECVWLQDTGQKLLMGQITFNKSSLTPSRLRLNHVVTSHKAMFDVGPVFISTFEIEVDTSKIVINLEILQGLGFVQAAVNERWPNVYISFLHIPSSWVK